MANPLEPLGQVVHFNPPDPGPVVEAKVKTSAAAGAASAGVLALLSIYLFHGQEVPAGLAVTVTTVVGTLVSGGITFLVGWLTKHTPRWLANVEADDTPPPPPLGGAGVHAG